MPQVRSSRLIDVRPGGARRGRRGVSLLEVVLSSVLLGIIATAVAGAISSIVTAEMRSAQRLEALELANRLILQYLDDEKSMPSESEHINQGSGSYRFTVRLTPIVVDMPEGSLLVKPAGGAGTVGGTMDAVELLSISVYAGVPDGGGYAYGERLCTLTRPVHPLSTAFGNPDRMQRIFADPGSAMAAFGRIVNQRNQPEAGEGGGRGSGGRPGSGSGGTGGRRPSGPSGGSMFNGARETRGGGK